MFAIAVEQQQYKTYILSDQLAQSRLTVVPERGGIVTSWQLRGQEMLYLDRDRFADPSLSIRGGIPILFPICGNLPENTYSYSGQTYTLKQHGFARDLGWQVVDRMTHDRVGITIALESNDQTRSVYPFDFELRFSYFLQGNALEIHQQVTNRSTVPMPFSIGLHPYFLVHDKPQLQFDIPASQYQNQIDQTVHDFAGRFDFEQDEIDVAFRSLTRSDASATDPARRLRLKVEFDPAFSTVVFWTVKGKDYYCLEPWTAPRNSLNTGDRLLWLDPEARLDLPVRLIATFL
ncbi:MAG: aldose epimerase [Microcoleus sp. SIO2G3]|nr:aldose epimerase [Microcoleus sp. SIO2G3]